MNLYGLIAVIVAVLLIVYTMQLFRGRRIRNVPYILWNIVWLNLIVIGIDVTVYEKISKMLGIETPINFLTTFSLLALFGIVFYNAQRIYTMEKNIEKIVQHLAIKDWKKKQR